MVWLCCAHCSIVIVVLGSALKIKPAPLAYFPRIPYCTPPLPKPKDVIKNKAPVVWKKEDSRIGVIQFKVLWDDKCVEGGWEEEHKAFWQAPCHFYGSPLLQRMGG